MSELTIAQGLRRIKKLKGELTQHQERARASVTYMTGCDPAYTFEESMKGFKSVQSELLSLESKLSVTNALTKVTFDGAEITLAEACRRLQELKGEITFIESLSVKAHPTVREEAWDYDDDMKRIKTTREWTCALPEKAQQETLDKLKTQFDRLNDAVETMNHRTVLQTL